MPDDEILSDSSPDEPVSTESETPEPLAADAAEKTDEAPKEAEDAADSEPKSEPAKGETAANSEEPKVSGKRNAETRIKQLTAQLNAVKRQVQTLSQPAQQAATAMKEPKLPTIDQFETIEQFNEALFKYDKEAREYAVSKDRIERDREAKKKAEQEEIDKTVGAFNKRAEKLKATNPDFDAKEAFERISPNPATIAMIFESEVGPEVTAFLDDNPDEAERLRDLPPIKCAREFFKLEQRISDQIKGIKKPAASVKPPSYVTGKAASAPAPKSIADLLYS